MQKILPCLALAFLAQALTACSGSITTSQYAGQPRHLLPRDHQEYSPQAAGSRSATALPDSPKTAVATGGQPSIDEENARLDIAMKICRNCLSSPPDDGAQQARRHEPPVSRDEIAASASTGRN